MYGQPQSGVAVPPGGYDYQTSQTAPGYGPPPPSQYPVSEYAPVGMQFSLPLIGLYIGVGLEA